MGRTTTRAPPAMADGGSGAEGRGGYRPPEDEARDFGGLRRRGKSDGDVRRERGGSH